MGHKKRKINSSSQSPDKIPVESTVAATAGSQASGTPGGPPEGPIERKADGHRPRWRRRLLWGCAIMAAVVVVLRIALWLSLPWIIHKTMAPYGLEAHYERLSLSLLTGDAELWHLTLVSTDANTPLTDVEYCRAEVSLLTLLTRRLVVPRLEIDGMDVSLTRARDGTFPQLHTLLGVLRERSAAVQPVKAQAASTSASPRAIDLTPPLKIDAMRLQHVQVHFQDESVTPVFETRLDLNVRLSDLRSDQRRTRFQVILSSPPVLDQLLVEGMGSSDARDLLADVKVALQGLHPGTVKDYLASLGVVPDAQNLAFACSGSIRVQGARVEEANDVDSQDEPPLAAGEAAVQSSPPTLQVHLESKNAVLTVDGMEQFTLEHVAVDANVPGSGAVRVSKIQVRNGAFHAWRRPTGVLSAAGFQFVGRSQPGSMVKSDVTTGADAVNRQSQAASASAGEAPGAWSLDGVEVRDVRFVLHDESVSPPANLELDLNEVAVANASSQSQGLALTARLGAPGIVESLQAGGTVMLSSSESTAALKLSGTGIRPDALQPHLKRLGIESLYKGGTFACDVNAAFSQQKGGRLQASASITNIRLQDSGELFGLKAIGVQGVKIDPNSGTTHIEQVEISGQRLALGRDETGCLTVLGFRLTGSPSQRGPGQAGASTQPSRSRAGGTNTAQNAGTATAGGPTARIEIGRLSWHDNELTFVDRMVTPARTIAIPDLGFELTNFVFGGEGGSASPASLKAWLRSPGTLERAELSGTVALQPTGLSFDLRLDGAGMALTEMMPYLRPLGIESTMVSGSIGAKTNGQLTWGAQGIRCSATIRDVAIKDGDVELAGFNQIDVAQLDLADTGLRVERITIDQPRLALSREESGVLSCVGLHTVAGIETGSETPSKATKSEPKKPESALPVRVGRLEVKDARIRWSDHAVVPAVSQALATDLTLTDFAMGVEAPPATLAVTVRAPGMIQQATVSGQVQMTPSKQGTDLKVEAAGIDAGPLLSYLPKGWEPALKEGQFRARIIADLMRHPNGGQRARVNITDMDYRGNSEQEPLLRFDSAELAVDRFDPNAHLISIQQVSLQGLEATVERKASGRMSLMGLEMGASESPAAGNSSVADKQPVAAASATDRQSVTVPTPSDEKAGRPSDVARKAQRLPLVTLERLSLQARKLTVKDEAKPTAAPIVISDLQIGNTEGVKLLGDEPDTNPPIKIDIHSQIQPLTESLQLKLELSPFIAQPQIIAEWDISQIHGFGLTSVLPELRTAVDANSLRAGRLSGNAQLTLRAERRNAAAFDFSKPFGLDLLVKAATFSDTETKTVLASLEELRVAIPRLDPNSGSVYVKEIGLVKPQGAISREADGLHVLGLILKTPAAAASADANAVAATSVADVNDATARRVEDSQGQGKPLDLRVDQLLVNGIDFSFADRTADPPMYMPLKGLDVEVRGFATPGAQAKEPMRFNINVTAGEVPLPGTKRGSMSAAAGSAQDSSQPSTENRLLFQEMSATGRLSLYPRPDGWVKAGLSGLELVNFEGLAKQKGMALRDGIFDASIDVRFHRNQPLSTRTRLVFTDLSVTEPPDGFLAKLLALPVSLDTVLFILRDAGGSIKLPLSFEVGENGLSGGQVAKAAVGAAATLIGSAVAGSPTRVVGTIGNILGGGKEEPTGAETRVVQYAAGVTTLSKEQTAELAKIRERLRRERDLSVTVRHNLGGGDIEKANGLVNLSPTEARELLEKLRQDRAGLQQARDELAGQARTAYAAGSRESVIVRTTRLQETETQLGLIERALDDLLETMRPGSEYAARRRTRDACMAIGKARLETLAAFLAIEGIPNAAGRITFVPPRFAEASDPAGGSITLTLTKSKAR